MTEPMTSRLVFGYVSTGGTPTHSQVAALAPATERALLKLDFRAPGETGRAFGLVIKTEPWQEVLVEQLQLGWPHCTNETQPGLWWGSATPPTPPTMAWIMPGSGSLGATFWAELTSLDPSLEEVRLAAEAAFSQHTGETLSFLELGDEADSRSTHPLYQRPATVTATVALARLLGKLGLTPNLLAGHSVGELTACHLAGCFDLHELMRLTSAPFKGGTLAPGAMAALIGPEEKIYALIQATGVDVVISNRNSPRQLVVSGLAAEIDKLVAGAKPAKLKAVALKVATAYHSPLLEQAHHQYRAALATSTFAPATVPVVSGLTTDVLPWATPYAQTRALLDCAFIGPVNHVGQVRRLQELGAGVILDLGPSDRLARLSREILEGQGVTVVAANTAKGGGRESFLECVAQLHILGYTVSEL